MVRVNGIAIRPLYRTDPGMISAAFQALGWRKPVQLYEQYVSEMASGDRHALVACVDEQFAGYVTITWASNYVPFRALGIPEIRDLNVLPSFQRRGVASRLLDVIESAAAERSRLVGLGVGLLEDYGPAQQLYIRRGYIPDGRGVAHGHRNVKHGEQVTVDDDLVLFLTKQVAA